jgi:WD40 repeat protein
MAVGGDGISLVSEDGVSSANDDNLWESTNLVLSPDGKKLVSIHDPDYPPKWDDRIARLWDTATRKLLKTVDRCFTESSRLVAFSPDCKMLAFVIKRSSTPKRAILVCDTATGETLHTLGDAELISPSSLAFSPNSKMLVLTSPENLYGDAIEIWDLATCVLLRKLLPRWMRNIVAVVSPNGGMVAAVEPSMTRSDFVSIGQIMLWDPSTEKPRVIITRQALTSALVFSPDDTMLASVGLGTSDVRSTINVWDTATGECRHILILGENKTCDAINFSPDSKTLVSSAQDGSVQFWDSATGVYRWSVELPCVVESLSFSEDGRYLETNLGTISATPASNSSTISGGQALASCVYHKEGWIYKDGRKVLWVPHRQGVVKVYGHTVIVGDHSSGLVTFIYID